MGKLANKEEHVSGRAVGYSSYGHTLLFRGKHSDMHTSHLTYHLAHPTTLTRCGSSNPITGVRNFCDSWAGQGYLDTKM